MSSFFVKLKYLVPFLDAIKQGSKYFFQLNLYQIVKKNSGLKNLTNLLYLT